MAQTVPEGTGLLVPVGDPLALSEALSQFMENASLQADLRSAALEARSTLRSWRQAASEFSELSAALMRIP